MSAPNNSLTGLTQQLTVTKEGILYFVFRHTNTPTRCFLCTCIVGIDFQCLHDVMATFILGCYNRGPR